MKIKVTKTFIALLIMSFFGLNLLVTNTFADSPYGMDYVGEIDLGEANVQASAEITAKLNGLTKLESGDLSWTYSGNWQDGYTKATSGPCRSVRYFISDSSVMPAGSYSYSYSSNRYEITVEYLDITRELLAEDAEANRPVTIAIGTSGFFDVGYPIYSDSGCTNETVPALNVSDNIRIYERIRLQIKDIQKNRFLSSDELYVDIFDIDEGQAVKILNSDNQLSRENMYTKDLSQLQPSSSNLRNKYVAGKNYIYSEPVFGISNNHIFVKLTQSTQQNGLDIVFAGVKRGGIGLIPYAKQYTINYTSDPHGSVTGITEETLLSGEHPSSTTTEVLEPDYILSHWTADQDVTLTNGTTIKAGDPINSSQLTQIVVHSNLTITAIHTIPEPEPTPEPTPTPTPEPTPEPTPDPTPTPEPDASTNEDTKDLAVPNTGENTAKVSATRVGVVALTVLATAARVIYLIRRYKKTAQA